MKPASVESLSTALVIIQLLDLISENLSAGVGIGRIKRVGENLSECANTHQAFSFLHGIRHCNYAVCGESSEVSVGKLWNSLLFADYY